MTRLASVLLALWCAGALVRAENPPSEVPVERATAAPPKSTVYTVTDPGRFVGYEPLPATEKRMVERLILAVTGEKDLKSAWSKLVQPKDVVGIKVSAAGGRPFSSHQGVVDAVVQGLTLAGVPRTQIIIWDRSTEDLQEAGFFDRKGGPRVRGIDPPRGYDPEAKFTAPILGQLIWGDLKFRGAESGLRRATLQETQTTPESHLARIISREVTKVISIPTMSDEPGCGVAGALYNVTVPNLDNSRRFTQGSGVSSICDLYADPRLGGKVVLTIVDGLLAQYAGGPRFNPNYGFAYRTLLASKDPVALDATILRQLERWRAQAKLPPLTKAAAWIQEAEVIGLGNYDPARINVQAVPWP